MQLTREQLERLGQDVRCGDDVECEVAEAQDTIARHLIEAGQFIDDPTWTGGDYALTDTAIDIKRAVVDIMIAVMLDRTKLPMLQEFVGTIAKGRGDL